MNLMRLLAKLKCKEAVPILREIAKRDYETYAIEAIGGAWCSEAAEGVP